MSISRRRFMRTMAAATMLPLVPQATRAAAPTTSASRRTNLLIITGDDFQSRLGCLDTPTAVTPNLDRLAQRGTLFRHAQCSLPVCNPSRLSLVSGLRCHQLNTFGNTKRAAHFDGVKFLPEWFRENGYFTGTAGKVFHQELIDHNNWDYESVARGRLSEEELLARAIKINGAGAPPRQTLDEKRRMPGAPVRVFDVDDDDVFNDHAWAMDIAGQLEQHANGQQPFLLWAGLFNPHVPHHVSKKYWEMHDPATKTWAEEPAEHLKNIPPAALNYDPASTRPDTDQNRRITIAAHDAAVSLLDAQVGRILDEMDRLKLWDNTVVLFVGDHGVHLGEHGGNYSKNTLFEEATNSPYIMAAPGMPQGQVCDAVVEYLDTLPTLLELCDLPAPPQQVVGRSLIPFLQNAATPSDRPAFTIARTMNGGHGQSVRTAKWKYNQWRLKNQPAGIELYDMESDPHQLINLAAQQPDHAAIPELRELMKASGI